MSKTELAKVVEYEYLKRQQDWHEVKHILDDKVAEKINLEIEIRKLEGQLRDIEEGRI